MEKQAWGIIKCKGVKQTDTTVIDKLSADT